MDNYDAFKFFLDTNDVRYDENSFDDGDRLVVIPQKIKSGALMNVMVIFSDIRIKILILGFASLEDENKKADLYEFFNEFNKRTGFFKMYLRGDEICVEGDFSTRIYDGEFNPEKFMDFIMAALFAVDGVYRDVMKILWF